MFRTIQCVVNVKGFSIASLPNRTFGIQINHSSVVDQDFNIGKIIEQNVMTNDYAPVTYEKTIFKNDLHNLSRTFSIIVLLYFFNTIHNSITVDL